MWAKLVKNLAAFPSAVVTGLNPEGYPFSIRCTPQIDHAQQVLHMQFPAEAMIQSGSAGLLCHSHDERLWNLKSFVVHGHLEQQADGWVFRPRRFIPGGGVSGPLGDIRTMINARRAAKQYLEKRRLPRPAIRWDTIKTLRAESKRNKPPDR